MPARLISALFELCLLRIGPQDLPHRPALALALLAAVLALEGYSSRLIGTATALGPSLLVSGAFALAATWAVLKLRGVDARFWQTFLALVGTGLLFSLLALPLLAAMGPLDPANPPQMGPLFGWGIVILAVWRLVVSGHIWRHALGIPLPTGVLVALGLFMAELLVQRALFAMAGAGPAAT
jgi:hypothetical protein